MNDDGINQQIGSPTLQTHHFRSFGMRVDERVQRVFNYLNANMANAA